ncbi:biopolymer transport protein ExbD [Gammaproteobacteria bacterium]
MNLRPTRKECPRFINLTSLIDVVFNLLIFFMVTTSFHRGTEIGLHLPNAETGKISREEPQIVVTVGAQGQYFVNQQVIEENRFELLQLALREAMQSAGSQPTMIIHADAQTSHQSVVTVLDAARRVGLTRLTFATQTPTK